ncbi:MAG TPA: hypothetical protein VI485_02670 [Vicinamibacterales bacterium]|nr:hypothetical protein [Vicinamibacterales bacterium]
MLRQDLRQTIGVHRLREGGQLSNAVSWRFATAMETLADIEEADGHVALACDAYRRAVTVFDAASRQTPLVDLVKADADRARARQDRCPIQPPH